MSIKLEQDERILFRARRHWFVLFGQVFGIIILLVAPFALFALAINLGVPMPHFLAGNLVFLGAALVGTWMLLLWIAFFVVWTNYFLDILILTNKKLIDMEQKSLFSREISSLRLERIQDITIEINGIIPTFLDFGDVHVQTAGGDGRIFILRGARTPARVKELILHQQQQSLEKSGVNNHV